MSTILSMSLFFVILGAVKDSALDIIKPDFATPSQILVQFIASILTLLIAVAFYVSYRLVIRQR